MDLHDNIIAFRRPEKNDDSDLHMTGAHMVEALRDEFEKQHMMTQGLSFSFDMLLYGLIKDAK